VQKIFRLVYGHAGVRGVRVGPRPDSIEMYLACEIEILKNLEGMSLQNLGCIESHLDSSCEIIPRMGIRRMTLEERVVSR